MNRPMKTEGRGGDVERMKEVVEEERKKKKEVEMKSNKRAE